MSCPRLQKIATSALIVNCYWPVSIEVREKVSQQSSLRVWRLVPRGLIVLTRHVVHGMVYSQTSLSGLITSPPHLNDFLSIIQYPSGWTVSTVLVLWTVTISPLMSCPLTSVARSFFRWPDRNIDGNSRYHMIERPSLATIQLMVLRTTGLADITSAIQNLRVWNESLEVQYHDTESSRLGNIFHTAAASWYTTCGSHSLSLSASPMTRIGRKRDPEIW